jgi:hypothetical protein
LYWRRRGENDKIWLVLGKGEGLSSFKAKQKLVWIKFL